VHVGGGFDADEAARILLGQESTASQGAVDDWLASNGMERGRAYEHSKCPIRPEYPSHACPVFVSEFGLHCKSCAVAGLCYRGCRKPVFSSFSMLIDPENVHRVGNRLRLAVVNLVHWDHAKHVVADADVHDSYAELTYRALLKLWRLAPISPKKPKTRKSWMQLIDRVFFPDVPMVRGNECWLHSDNKRELIPHPCTKLVKVSAKLLRASALPADEVINDCLQYVFSITQEQAFLNGSGVKHPSACSSRRATASARIGMFWARTRPVTS
jgi:hypothetical protein